MSKLKFRGDITHTEKYTDKQSGEEKKKYTKAGSLWEREDGSLCIKLFDTWMNVYPPKATDKDFKNLRENIAKHNEPLDDELPPF